ncbi:TfoX/Sxy family protein [Anaerospora hongkongensis]|uniref:TfoX/Sxy family protein n=1 Tax=Anaerospora hongkongensis TaxID=244830 RepID=UPI002898C771|nr:TfoX/Sxy family protein [Anaerospora hongkongensis]
MKKLSQMPNIGITLEKLLLTAGIDSPAALQKLGSQSAFIKLTKVDPTACLHKLYALEGAIQGHRWHTLPEERKKELKRFFQNRKE